MKLHLLKQEGDCGTLGLMGKLAVSNPESGPILNSGYYVFQMQHFLKNPTNLVVLSGIEFNYQLYFSTHL